MREIRCQMQRSLIAIWFCIGAMCLGACNEEQSSTLDPSVLEQTTKVQAHFQELFNIGSNENATKEYLLGNPKFVVTNSRGDIFIADEAIFGIKVYDKTGTFIRTIGRHGEGPGEIKRITSFTISQNGHIVIGDESNSRITIFSQDGAIVKTYSYAGLENINTPRSIVHLEDDRYLFIYKLQGDAPYDDMAHIITFGSDLEEITSFISFSQDLGFSGVAAARLISGGHVCLLSPSDLLFVPQLHQGVIYRYHFNLQQRKWEQQPPLRGYVNVEDPFEELDPNNYDPDEILYRSMGPEGLRVGTFNNQSQGIFELTNGNVVHFAYNLIGDKRIFNVDLFNNTGEFLGNSPVIILNKPETKYYPFNVVWKDEQDRFYIVDRRGAPTIRVVKLEYRVDEMVTENFE